MNHQLSSIKLNTISLSFYLFWKSFTAIHINNHKQNMQTGTNEDNVSHHFFELNTQPHFFCNFYRWRYSGGSHQFEGRVGRILEENFQRTIFQRENFWKHGFGSYKIFVTNPRLVVSRTRSLQRTKFVEPETEEEGREGRRLLKKLRKIWTRSDLIFLFIAWISATWPLSWST